MTIILMHHRRFHIFGSHFAKTLVTTLLPIGILLTKFYKFLIIVSEYSLITLTQTVQRSTQPAQSTFLNELRHQNPEHSGNQTHNIQTIYVTICCDCNLTEVQLLGIVLLLNAATKSKNNITYFLILKTFFKRVLHQVLYLTTNCVQSFSINITSRHQTSKSRITLTDNQHRIFTMLLTILELIRHCDFLFLLL